jgi:hypothetical protein
MARLVFLRRAQYDFATYGGEVFFDINNKNVGKLAATDCFVDLPAGTYQIKMYKLHYNTMIGFAQETVTVQDGECVMLQYVMPTTIAEPGHIIISDYSQERADSIIASIDTQMYQKQQNEKKARAQAERGNKAVVGWIIGGAIAVGVLSALSWLMYMFWVDSLF